MVIILFIKVINLKCITGNDVLMGKMTAQYLPGKNAGEYENIIISCGE